MPTSTRKVVLITGAATGVGRACAIGFARQGFNVAINFSRSKDEAIDTQRCVRLEGVDAELFQADVSQDQQVQAMVASVKQQFGQLDVLVNCAATTFFIDACDLDAMTEEKWDRVFAVNVKGAFFCSRAAAPLLSESGEGSIVNISSVAGESGQGSSIAYSASKGALNTLTKTLARALAPKIRVNAVCPGPVDSRWLLADMTSQEIHDLAADWPIPRPAKPEDVATSVLYLCNETTFTTGQLLTLDGGRTM